MNAESDLAFIQRCVRERRLLWTYHVNMRLQRRSIARPWVLESVESYRTVERYPQGQNSWYLPSYLIYAEYSDEAVHILFAIDRERGNVRIVTAYRPDPAEWEPGFLRRRQS